MRNASTPDPHGKVRSDAERKAAIRRAESELSLLSSDRLKVERRTSDRNLLLRKSREDLRRIQGDIERLEREAKKDETELRTIEENIRFAKKRLVTL